MPSFSEKVLSFTILIESGKNLKYVSPKVTDPDAQLGKMKFKMEPEIDCPCFTIKQNNVYITSHNYYNLKNNLFTRIFYF